MKHWHSLIFGIAIGCIITGAVSCDGTRRMEKAFQKQNEIIESNQDMLHKYNATFDKYEALVKAKDTIIAGYERLCRKQQDEINQLAAIKGN